jgi:hypothetical protein
MKYSYDELNEEYTFTYENGDVTVTHSLRKTATLDEVVSQLELFLKSVGFVFDSLDVVDSYQKSCCENECCGNSEYSEYRKYARDESLEEDDLEYYDDEDGEDDLEYYDGEDDDDGDADSHEAYKSSPCCKHDDKDDDNQLKFNFDKK